MTNVIDQERAAVFAEEAFVVDAQLFLHRMMEEKGISQADLARAMGLSRARISQIFSDECKNFTVRLFARAVHAMGERPQLTCQLFLNELEAKIRREQQSAMRAADNVIAMWDTNEFWAEPDWACSANDNRLAGLISQRHESERRKVA